MRENIGKLALFVDVDKTLKLVDFGHAIRWGGTAKPASNLTLQACPCDHLSKALAASPEL